MKRKKINNDALGPIVAFLVLLILFVVADLVLNMGIVNSIINFFSSLV